MIKTVGHRQSLCDIDVSKVRFGGTPKPAGGTPALPGNVPADGDSVTLIKDLPLKGSSQVIKGVTKAKNIRLVDGDHEISCKMDGMAIGLKAQFVKKA